MSRTRKPGPLPPTAPLRHPDHRRPVSRRDFLAQGFISGAAAVIAPTVLGLFASPRAAEAALSSDLQTLKQSCGIAIQGAGKVPFICFDLAGGANIAGSNVLMGKQGGQLDFLSTAGYDKLGLPGDMIPAVTSVNGAVTRSFIDTQLGLAFHSDSAMLRGIIERVAPATAAATNGAVIAARSENDTGNNPHNPMYAIYRAGADGELLTLIGSRSSDSGGNSVAPAAMIDPQVRPTKVDRTSDVTGLVDTGKLVGLLSQSDAVAVMESIQRLSDRKLGKVSTGVTRDAVIKDLLRCGYVKSADLADRYGDPSALNPELDLEIVGAGGEAKVREVLGDRVGAAGGVVGDEHHPALGQRVDHFLVDRNRHLALRHVDDRAFARHVDGFGHGADLQIEIDAGLAADREVDARELRVAEAGGRHRNGVHTGGQRGETIVTGGIGLHLPDANERRAADFHRRPGHNRAGWIFDGALNAGRGFLAKTQRQAETQIDGRGRQ